MPREKLLKIIEAIGQRAPGMANLTRAVIQKMLKGSLERGQIRSNPLAVKVTAYKVGTHHTWTNAELAQFEKRWPLGTRQRLAYALLFYTGNERRCRQNASVGHCRRLHRRQTRKDRG